MPKANGDNPNNSVTRRDFVGGTLLGAGSALLAGSAPSIARAAASTTSTIPNIVLDAAWTGPGGVGDYAQANGNTHTTVNAAHAVRDGALQVTDTGVEPGEYDLVIVGGGIAGLATAYEFLKAKGPQARVLVLDNNAIFGGEAKQNELEVDGHRLYGPQGSNMCVWPARAAEKLNFFWHPLWRELGLPMGDEPDAPVWSSYGDMLVPKNDYSAMMVVRDRWPQAQFFRDPKNPSRWKHAISPWTKGYRDLPWPEEAKQQLSKVDAYYPTLPEGERDLDHWMDSMTYKEYLTRMVGVTRPEVFRYIDPQIASYGTGLGSSAISAMAARDFLAPGTATAEELDMVEKRRLNPETLFEPIAFPGGNATIARYFLKRMLPDALQGSDSLLDVVYGAVRWDALDQQGQRLQVRVDSTAVAVQHDGVPEANKGVLVTYIKNRSGERHRVRGKAVVMASGQWINKHILKDVPPAAREAMNEFHHAPMLVVNVGLRHWRFIHKLGTPALRWFDGLAWFTNLKAPMSLQGHPAALHPDKPAMLTFYIPYTTLAPTGTDALPLSAQCLLSRTALFNMSYSEIERRIRRQLASTLGPYGFDHKRDIAALITNRWGHGYVVPGPGFFFGSNGKEAPREIVRRGYGKIRFSHSELTGVQLWPNACKEGARAAQEVLALGS